MQVTPKNINRVIREALFIDRLLSDWLLLNTTSAIFQLCHGQNKLSCNEVRFVLDQHS
jgi:hypothetical protein